MKTNVKDFLKIILKTAILLASIFIILLLISILESILSYFFGTDDKFLFIIGKIFNTLGVTFIIFLYFKDKFNLFHLLKDQFCHNSKKLIISMVSGILLGIIAALCLYLIGFMKFNGFVWQKFYAEDIIPVMFIGVFECLFEAFYEELVYRFAIANIVLDKYNWICVFVFSTIIYTATYAFDSNISIVVIINIAFVNILMMTVYLKYKNIWMCVLSRSLFEYIVSYGFSISRYGNEIDGLISFKQFGNSIVSGGTYGIYGSIIMTGLLVIVISLLWFCKNIKKFVTEI